MRWNRLLMWVVPSLFFLAMAYVTVVAYARVSGVTGMDAAEIQSIRVRVGLR